MISFYPSAIREAERQREETTNAFIDAFGLQEYFRFINDIPVKLQSFHSSLHRTKFNKLSQLRLFIRQNQCKRDWWSETNLDDPSSRAPLSPDTRTTHLDPPLLATSSSSQTDVLITSQTSLPEPPSSDPPPSTPEAPCASPPIPSATENLVFDTSPSMPVLEKQVEDISPIEALAPIPLLQQEPRLTSSHSDFQPPVTDATQPLRTSGPAPCIHRPASSLLQEVHISESILSPTPAPTRIEPTCAPEGGFLAHSMEPITLRQDSFSSVINLSSSFSPTVTQLSVLSKGANFCPVPPQIDEVQARLDIAAWQRRVRLAEFFSDKQDTSNPSGPNAKAPFKQKSTWNPPRRCQHTENYLKTVETEFFRSLKEKPKFHYNLSAQEHIALKQLAADSSITIKEADKGSGIVIMDTSKYIQEGERQLHDTSTYQPLDHDPSPQFEKELATLVNEAATNGTLTPEMATYAIPSEYKLARFYLLPKVHKKGVPGRPVVSCSGSLSERLSEIVDFLLKPFLPFVDSYLKDTKHFLSKFRSLPDLPPGALLVSLDVVGLYPSIPHSEGLAALFDFLVERGVPHTTASDIVKLAKFVLENNVFEFNSKIFLQISGTAIGTRMAPTYAIIYMHILETKFLNTSPLRPLVWWRFIDDAFAVWLHGRDKLEEFILFLNTHKHIKWTWSASSSSQQFLDVLACIIDGKPVTDLYTKPTDTHQFLHPASCHPGHIKRSIAFSQALRILNICSDPSKAHSHLDDLASYLTTRGHSKKKVHTEIKKAKARFEGISFGHSGSSSSKADPTSPPSDPSTIQTHTRSPKQRIPLVLTYHPGLPNISEITRRFLPVLHLNPLMKLHCPDPPLLSFRRPRNLRDSLVRAKVADPTPLPRHTCGPCSARTGTKRGRKCELCPLIPIQSSITSSCTGSTFPLRLSSPADCSSSAVVYCLTCTKCPTGYQYVGQTSNFRHRMNNHKSAIRTGREDDRDCALLYAHFKLPGHSPQTLKFTILQQVGDKVARLEAETRWMLLLKTLSPSGLNISGGIL